MSQPAVSAALAKLRETYNDGLLVMVGRSFELTEKGEELLLQAERACNELEILYNVPTFDPQSTTQKFVIGTADYVAYLLAPIVSQILETEAPCATFQFVDAPAEPHQNLARGAVDIIMVPSDTANFFDENISSDRLFTDEMVVIASRRHRSFEGELTKEIYQSSRHARFKFGWDALTHQDYSLAAAKINVHDCVFVQQFALLPSIVERSGCLALTYRSLADQFRQMHDIEIFNPPFEMPESTVTAFWWRSRQKDQAHAWCRGLLRRASAELGLT